MRPWRAIVIVGVLAAVALALAACDRPVPGPPPHPAAVEAVQTVLRAYAKNDETRWTAGLEALKRIAIEDIRSVPVAVAPDRYGVRMTLRFDVGGEVISLDDAGFRRMHEVASEWAAGADPVLAVAALERLDAALGQVFEAAKSREAVVLRDITGSMRLSYFELMRTVKTPPLPPDLDEREVVIRSIIKKPREAGGLSSPAAFVQRAVNLAGQALTAYGAGDGTALRAALDELAAFPPDLLKHMPVRFVPEAGATNPGTVRSSTRLTVDEREVVLPPPEQFRLSSGVVDAWVAERPPAQAAGGLDALDVALAAVALAANRQGAEHAFSAVGAIRAQTLTQLVALGDAAPKDAAERLAAVRATLVKPRGR